MWLHYDPDEFETVSQCTPCSCGGLGNCNGRCNGSASITTRRRSQEEIDRIKAERQRQHEDKVLAEAEAIKARRAWTS